MPDGRTSVDDYLDGIPKELQDVAGELRRVIREAAPDASEVMKWGQPVYDAGGPFVALKAHPRHVTLTFWRGATLPDPTGLLAGDGDRMRHARFSTAESVDADAVAELVRAAVNQNRELGDPTRRGQAPG
jgi:hypothetical protein